MQGDRLKCDTIMKNSCVCKLNRFLSMLGSHPGSNFYLHVNYVSMYRREVEKRVWHFKCSDQ